MVCKILPVFLVLSNCKEGNARYTKVNSSKRSHFCLSRTLTEARDAPPKAKEAQMPLQLMLKSGESPWTYRGTARSKPGPAHVSHAVEPGAGKHGAASCQGAGNDPGTQPAAQHSLAGWYHPQQLDCRQYINQLAQNSFRYKPQCCLYHIL